MQPDMESYCQYLTYVTHALIRRLGGEIKLDPEEIWRAAKEDALWEQEGEALIVKLGPAQ
jgi:hypothetical protein